MSILGSVLDVHESESVIDLDSSLKLFIMETVGTRQTGNQFEIYKSDYHAYFTK